MDWRIVLVFLSGVIASGCESDSDALILPSESDFPDLNPENVGDSDNTNGDANAIGEDPANEISAPIAPSNAVAPTLVGEPLIGAVFSVEVGEWEGRVERFGYQWFIDDVADPDEQQASIVVRSEFAGSSVRAEVTASNAVGESTVSSDSAILPLELEVVGLVPPLFDENRGEALNPFPTQPGLWGALGGPVRFEELGLLGPYNGVRYAGSRSFHRIADSAISLSVNDSIITSVVVGEGSSGRVTIVFRDGTLDMFGRESQLAGPMHSPEVTSSALGSIELLDVAQFDNGLWRYQIRLTLTTTTPALRIGVGPFYEDPSETTAEDIRIYGLGVVLETP